MNERNEDMSTTNTTNGIGDAADLEKAIDLPGLKGAFSELAVPIVARDELLGVLCLQSETPGRFQPEDEAIANLAAREIGLSIALLRASGSPERKSATTPTISRLSSSALSISKVSRGVQNSRCSFTSKLSSEYLLPALRWRRRWRLP